MSRDDRDASRGPATTLPTEHIRGEAWRYAPLVLAAILVALSIVAHVAFRDVVTSDLEIKVLRWYAKFQKLGIRVALGKDFYDYSPPYMYLIALATLSSRFLSALTAVKMIAAAFDVYVAIMVFKIVRLRCQHGFLPFLAAAIWFSAPTVLANSAVWGQADSTYMAFLLTCLYLLLIDKPWLAMVFFSVSFAIKPQAIFLAPLLVLLLLWRRIPWYAFLLVPAIYALAVWPAVAFGKTWLEVINIYLARPAAGRALTHNAASAYVFVPRTALNLLAGPGVVIAALIILAWIWYSWRFARRTNRSTLLLLALVSVTLCPFVLPNMHERYFYPADTISIALAFSFPELWFIPVLFQVISGLSDSIYLLSASADNLAIAASLNLFTLIILLAKQVLLNQEHAALNAAESMPA